MYSAIEVDKREKLLEVERTRTERDEVNMRKSVRNLDDLYFKMRESIVNSKLDQAIGSIRYFQS